MNINRQIQEIFYDFILNILVELNKDRIINPFPKNEQNVNTNISAEEKIFKKIIEDSSKYNGLSWTSIFGFASSGLTLV